MSRLLIFCLALGLVFGQTAMHRFSGFELDSLDSDVITGGYVAVDSVNATVLAISGVALPVLYWGQDTFADNATIDTIIVSGVSASSAVIAVVVSSSPYALGVQTVADTVFIYRSESDTTNSDVYKYIIAE